MEKIPLRQMKMSRSMRSPSQAFMYPDCFLCLGIDLTSCHINICRVKQAVMHWIVQTANTCMSSYTSANTQRVAIQACFVVSSADLAWSCDRAILGDKQHNFEKL